MNEQTLRQIDALEEHIMDLKIATLEVDANTQETGFLVESLNTQADSESDPQTKYLLKGAIANLMQQQDIANRQKFAYAHNQEAYEVKLKLLKESL